MQEKQILVLGVGNILLRDEGIGVRIIEQLQSNYCFSANVELMDGGTLGLRLLDPIAQAEHLIVVDAVQNGQAPGTLYRLPTMFNGYVICFNRQVVAPTGPPRTGCVPGTDLSSGASRGD